MERRNPVKYRNLCKELLSSAHIGLILPLFVPMICLLSTQRQDQTLPLMYLAGTMMIICAAASRLAARRAGTLPLYLAICLISSGLVVLGGMMITGSSLPKDLRNLFVTGQVIGCVWTCMLSAGIRMREKRRQQAKRENDISWRETTGIMDNPGWFGVGMFVVSYTVSLLNNCPLFCSTALIGGIVYSLLFLVWREMDVADDFLEETKRIENVPKRKILAMRCRKLILLGSLIIAAGIPAIVTGGSRTYRDLRFMSFSTVIDGDKLHFRVKPTPLEDILPDWFEETLPGGETPEIFRQLNRILIWIAMAGIVVFLLWLIREYAGSFRGIPEENGDEAIPLTPDASVRVKTRGIIRRRGPLSGREKVRREYRRTIRAYRKRTQLPGPCETPSQIEEGTDFPEGFDVQALHEAYEKARYDDRDS